MVFKTCERCRKEKTKRQFSLRNPKLCRQCFGKKPEDYETNPYGVTAGVKPAPPRVITSTAAGIHPVVEKEFKRVVKKSTPAVTSGFKRRKTMKKVIVGIVVTAVVSAVVYFVKVKLLGEDVADVTDGPTPGAED